ncbi:MAG: hypothetical protein AAB610_01530 [Patescibacteria group bacterium]
MKLSITKTLVLACAIAISSIALTALAESGSSNPLKERAEARFEKNSEIRNEKSDDLRGLRKDFDDNRKELRASTTNAIGELRKNFRENDDDESDDDSDDDCKNILVSSTTPGLRRDCIEDKREDRRDDRKELRASTTEMFKKFKDDRKDIMEKMRKDAFEIRKGALVEHLNFALENLLNIRGRINERIIKVETEGRDMTEAKAQLIIADKKLADARIAVDALGTLNISTGNTSAAAEASTTAEIELTKPRQVGDAAIRAVKDARDAFKKVVGAIAKKMSRGKGNGTATSTATTTASTTTTI